MYKKQMLFQKLICYLALATGFVVFLYSLGIMTDLYDCLYSTMMDPSDLTYTTVPGSIVYYNMQGFNKAFLSSSIVMLLLACLLFVTQTNNRRKYYIGNYVATGLFVVATIVIVIWAHFQIQEFRAQWLAVDFEALKMHAQMFKQKYTESTFWFDIHYGVFALCLVEVGLLIYNCIWKINLMKAERELIAKGGAV